MAFKIDSRSLEVFLAVCDAGSMTGAAKLLGVTQGAVSQQISRLETVLDLKLIARDSRELRLLPAGLHLRHHARRVLEEIRECERSMERFSGFSFPHLAVGIMDTLGKALTSTVVETLQNVVERIRVKSSVTYRHREDLLSGEIDMVITAQAFEGREFEIYPIASEPLMLVVPKGYITLDNLDLDMLSGSLPLVRFAHQRRLGRMADQYLARQMVVVERSIQLDQIALMIDSVRRGQGWAITTPFGLLDTPPEHLEVDVLPLPPPVPLRTISLVTKTDRFGTLPRTLAENCRRYLGGQITSRLSHIAPLVVPSIILHD